MSTKQKVFELLSKNTGSYISGEKLAQKCVVPQSGKL